MGFRSVIFHFVYVRIRELRGGEIMFIFAYFQGKMYIYILNSRNIYVNMKFIAFVYISSVFFVQPRLRVTTSRSFQQKGGYSICAYSESEKSEKSL